MCSGEIFVCTVLKSESREKKMLLPERDWYEIEMGMLCRV